MRLKRYQSEALNPVGKLSCGVFFIFIFIYLFNCTGSRLRHAGSSLFVVACRIFFFFFSCSMHVMRDLVPDPGPCNLGAQSLSHWTTCDVWEAS